MAMRALFDSDIVIDFPMRTGCYLTFALLVGMGAVSLPAVSGAEQSLAGEQASWVTVEPRPTPVLPEGPTGIAARYPGDVGIENDPDVVFVETFEGSVDEICSRWESVGGRQIASVSDEVVPGSGGKQSLLLTRVAGGTDGYRDGGNFYRRIRNDQGGFGYDQLFFRFYMKFNPDHAPFITTAAAWSDSGRPHPGPRAGPDNGLRGILAGQHRSNRAI
jgi:hypothetical protein